MPRATHFGFCFTLNDYTDDDLYRCNNAVGHRGITYLCYGKEIGGVALRPHLQGYLQTTQDKFDRLKLYFGRTIHLEKQKADSRLAKEYTKKDDPTGQLGLWFEFGTYRHIASVGQGSRTDLDDVRVMIHDGKTYEEICEAHFGTVARNDRFITKLIQVRDSGKRDAVLRERLSSASLRPWQQDLMDLLQGEPHQREILWRWDPEGNSGKSWMTTYLAVIHGAVVFNSAKVVDLAHIWSKQQSKIVVFDLARTQEGFLHGMYSFAESLKNGIVCSTKYDGQTIKSDPPHVVVFANFEPDRSKWSQDRYNVLLI